MNQGPPGGRGAPTVVNKIVFQKTSISLRVFCHKISFGLLGSFSDVEPINHSQGGCFSYFLHHETDLGLFMKMSFLLDF